MKVFNSIEEWQCVRKTLATDLSIGFVPTMGNLHVAHASLYEKSRQENDCTVASIFINKTQFNRPDDFTHYPRTLADDLSLLSRLGVDYCLLPDETEIYADGYHYRVEENTNNQFMEGQQRPGHFTGVLTVVMKLLNLVKPQRAYFGEKDYQQFQLIHDMVAAFFMDIDVIKCPTLREHSGLPYSSRNNRLDIEQRKVAEQFARIFHQPTVNKEQIVKELNQIGVAVEYVEEQDGRRFIAVNVGDIRLIDNYLLNN